MKVKIDNGKCIGCALCNALVGDVFELDPSGFKSRVKSQANLGAKNIKLLKEAELACPVAAIKVIDA